MRIKTRMSGILGVALAVAIGICSAAAEEPNPDGNALKPDCDRACLDGFVTQYMDALAAKDPSRVAWATKVRFTENNVPLMIGDGLWGSITGMGKNDLTFADPQTGEVGLFGSVEEHGVPSYYAMRLKVVQHKIAEVETAVNRIPPARPGAPPSPFGQVAPMALKHFPAMMQIEPLDERVARARMADIANGYFSTLQDNDGTLLTSFAPDCQRLENGIATAGNPDSKFPGGNLSCGEQFKRGNYRFDSGVRDRAFLVIDQERGLVLARAFLDHNAAMMETTLPNGKEVKSGFRTPSTLYMLELFKIRDGQIYRVEVTYVGVPYHMRTAWPAGKAAH